MGTPIAASSVQLIADNCTHMAVDDELGRFMYLIQIFLPMYGNADEKFPVSYYREVRNQLVERFGGITAYTRSPAHGLWQPEEGKTVQDDLVIYEVMAEELDRSWWSTYKATLEHRFQQEAMIVRAQAIYLL